MTAGFNPKTPNFHQTGIPDEETKDLISALNQLKNAVPRSIIGGDGTAVRQFGDRYIVGSPSGKTAPFRQLKTFLVYQEFDDYLKCVSFDYVGGTIQLHNDTLGTSSNLTTTQQTGTDLANELNKEYAQSIAETQDDDDETGVSDESSVYPINTPQLAWVYVAKARLLQRTPFDGKTVTLRRTPVAYSYSNAEFGGRTASPTGSPSEYQVITPPYFQGDIITARGVLATGYKTQDPDVVPEGMTYYYISWEDMNTGGRQWAVDPSGPPS